MGRLRELKFISRSPGASHRAGLVQMTMSFVPFGTLTPVAIAAGTLLPMLLHPGEMFAAAVWFSLVTWLMYKTKNIWDCVVAHAVTNLLLGVWVVTTGDWYFL